MISVPDPRPGASDPEPSQPAIIPLAEATDPSICGRKAGELARLMGMGLPVPDGFVVTGTADLSSTALRQAVEARLDHLGHGALAVRSSSAAEDLGDASFAGIYDTILGVTGTEAVIDAIRRVRDSGSAERATAYRHEPASGAAQSEMAVLVQRMVRADAAGVAFTADPLTGDRSSVVVSAVKGLGDRLVSGEAMPTEWIVGPAGAVVRRAADGAIDAVVAGAVADLARRVESLDRTPTDIEWAIADGKVYVLQARPMTALPDSVSWEPGLAGVWLRDLRLGEWLGAPVTPLFESWGLTRIEATMDRTLAGLLGMTPPQPSHIVVNGWYFYGFNIIPTKPAAMLAQLVRHLIPSFIVRPRKAAMAIPQLAGFGIAAAERDWRQSILPEYRALVETAKAEVEVADGPALVRLIDRLTEGSGGYFASVTMVAGYASKTEVPLAKFYGTHLRPRIGGSHLDLLVGL
ncbi:MAG TPA: PEP/pyruvate-binding domain-containing protein, partial [Candidatus Limnocylindrales bacterium]|nr:PEP/pyruvate-binding domain-containing protein [Candidatus Limnocylindrales bacterium]